MTLAEKINNFLTPVVRKYLYIVVSLIATVAVIWGLSTTSVNMWVALVVAVGGLGSQILSAVLTKRPDMTVLYGLAVAVIAALVTLRFLNPSLAGQIDNTLAAVVAVFSGISFARTDLSTPAGSPAAEVPAVTVTLDTTTPDVTPVADPVVVASPTVMAIPGATVFDPGNGTPPTTTLS